MKIGVREDGVVFGGEEGFFRVVFVLMGLGYIDCGFGEIFFKCFLWVVVLILEGSVF